MNLHVPATGDRSFQKIVWNNNPDSLEFLNARNNPTVAPPWHNPEWRAEAFDKLIEHLDEINRQYYVANLAQL